jgi:hypothetical protein
LAANAKALKEYDWIVYWKTNDRPAESPNEAISHDPHPNSSPDDPYGSGNSGPMRIFPGEKGDMLLFQRKFREKGGKKGTCYFFRTISGDRHFRPPLSPPFSGFRAPVSEFSHPAPPSCRKKGTCYFFRGNSGGKRGHATFSAGQRGQEKGGGKRGEKGKRGHATFSEEIPATLAFPATGISGDRLQRQA